MSLDRDRGRAFWLGVRAFAASLYFALMFFVATPGAILYFTRDEPFATGGALAVATGVAVIAAANAFVGRLIAAFIREGDGTHVPLDPPRRFVATSAYRRTRNPMYLAYIAVVLGEAVLFQSLALVVYGAVLWVVAHLYVCYREEPLLDRRFGDSYRDYRRRVPRWLSPARSDP
jgi:protein-S-isoprenylcysteine O-methyltransferase Ste14